AADGRRPRPTTIGSRQARPSRSSRGGGGRVSADLRRPWPRRSVRGGGGGRNATRGGVREAVGAGRSLVRALAGSAGTASACAFVGGTGLVDARAVQR